jgi:flagellar basal body rod protein FlgB
MALVDSTQQLLQAAMRGSWQRETALTNNIANADTPGYQPQ